MKVSELMRKEPMLVYGGNTVQQAAELMKKEGHGIVVALDNQQDKNVVGVLTNKDIINRVIAGKKDPETTFVKNVMTKSFIAIQPEKSTAEAMILMHKHGIKRIVVMDEGIVQGILHDTDIIGGMLQHKKKLLDMALDF